MVKAIIFDMDGLMFDTERLGIEAWNHASALLGYEMPEQLPYDAIGRSVADCRQMVLEQIGPEFDFIRARELYEGYITEYVASNGVPIKEGLCELLDYLSAKKISCTVATSSLSKTAHFFLKDAGIEDRFADIVTASMVAHGKPEPDLFLESAKRLALAPSDCLVLEDSAPGIIAAHRAGCAPIWIPDLKPIPTDVRALATAEYPSLLGVIDHLEGQSL